MNNLNELNINPTERMLFVGMGNRIKRDDGVGIYIAKQLKKQGIENVVIAENSIENYIGKINQNEPHSIIFIDAVDTGAQPGDVNILPIRDLTNTTTNTHNLSLNTISTFFDVEDQRVLAIQPGDVAFGTGLTYPVEMTANRVTALLVKRLKANHQILKP